MNRKLLSVVATVVGLAAFTAAIAILSHNPVRLEPPYEYVDPEIEIEDEPEYELEPEYESEPVPEPEPEPELESDPNSEPEPVIEDEYETEAATAFEPVFHREPLPEHIIAQIDGVTFHYNTPFDHSFLTYLTVTHMNFDGEPTIGHLIVAEEIGEEVLIIFQEIFEDGFPIYSIRLIDYFNAQDYYSMSANNSHAFNFRTIAGTDIISRHGFGMAIDINPIQNPYIRGDTIWPAAGAEYLDRSNVRPGMIIPGSVVYYAFVSRGWTWGGHWSSPRDYHHFEKR